MKIALAMIVKGSDEEADNLKRCLESVREHVDAAYITITQPNDKVRKVAEAFNCVVSEYEWDNHFANARNYNFSQVPEEYDYIFWLDADDVVRGIEKLRDTIEDHPKTDCFSMMYLYAFDEHKRPVVVHQKTRVVKNDGCVKWEGALHEDFSETRTIERKAIDGVEVLHMSNETRWEGSKVRNLEVAKADMEKNPNDPRSYWNLGNALKAAGENDEAIPVLEKFLEKSHSEDEKYIVRLRLAECYLARGDQHKAIEAAQYAIGLKIDYPDAYHLAGHICFDMKKFEDALGYFKQGLMRKPPYYRIIVFNPRDYDYTPLMAMAKCYFQLNQPMLAYECLKACLEIYPKDKSLKQLTEQMKEESEAMEKALKHMEKLRDCKDEKKLKAELDKLPDDVKSHPMVCMVRNMNFVKEKSSGKDIAIYCNKTEKVWTAKTADTEGLGGSEEAVVNLSKEFVKAGYNVEVYNNCGHKEVVEDGVVYKPYWSWNYKDKQDIVILWRNPLPLDYDINADKIFLDLHDVIKEGDLTEKRVEKLEKIFVKSKFHRSLFPKVADNKFVVVPNGLQTKYFEKNIERDPYLLVNTSSPDRSLGVLVDLFRKVKKRVPEAKLEWAYGWDFFDMVHRDDPESMKWKKEVRKKIDETEGFEELGRVDHQKVAEMYQRAAIFAYPTEFAEIDCISARKAQLGGAYPVTTDFAALNETVKYGYKVKSKKNKDNWCKDYQFEFGLEDKKAQEEWVNAVVDQLKNPIKDRSEMMEWAKSFNWENVAKKWLEQF